MVRSFAFGLSAFLVLSSLSFAGTNSYNASQKFKITAADPSDHCSEVAAVLAQVSSDDLLMTITNRCSFHKAPSKGWQIFGRVLVDIGTWGIAEIGCKMDHDCDKAVDYDALSLSIETSGAGPLYLGKPVAVGDEDCAFYAESISNLDLSNSNASFTATCQDGVLSTTFTVKK